VNQMRSQGGMALVAALFVIIVLATLGLFATRNSTANHDLIILKLQQDRGVLAAQYGIEWAASSIATVATCNAANPAPALFPPDALNGFTVIVVCQQATNHVPEGLTFDVTSTAAFGAFGSPTFVSRTLRARIPR
jgi:MSHA biogenesis protein MshP